MDALATTAITQAAAVPAARTEAERTMAVLGKALEATEAGAARLLEALPAADDAKGHRLDTYA